MFPKAKWVNIAAITVLIGLAAFAWKGFYHALKFDNSVSVWFLDDDPLVEQYKSFQQLFGNDETLFMLVRGEGQEEVLSDEFLQKVRKLQDTLSSLAYVKSVSSPASIDVFEGSVFGMPRYKKLWSNDYDNKQRQTYLERQKELKQLFFNNDYTAVAYYIQPVDTPAFHLLRASFIEQVTALSYSIFPKDKVHFGGVGIIYNALNVLSQNAFGSYVSLTIVIIFLLLYVFYRSMRFLLIVFLSLLSASYFSIAIYGALGYQLNIMTSLTPIIIIVLGVMDLVHIINRQHALPEASHFQVLKAIVKPCLITSLTTMVGFLALSGSPMFILRQFGLFSALGIFFAFVFSFFYAYLLLKKVKTDTSVNSWLENQWNRLPLKLLATKHRLVLLFLLLGVGFVGAWRVNIDSDTMAYLPDDDPVILDQQLIMKEWGAYLPVELIIRSKNPEESPISASNISKLNALSTEIVDNHIGLDKAFGMHSFFTIGARSLNQLDVNKTLSSALYFRQIEKGVKRQYPKLFNQYYRQDSVAGRITFFTKASSASEMDAQLQLLNQQLVEKADEQLSLTVAGYLPMYAGIIDYVIETQLYGILIAIISIFLLLYFLLQQFRLAFIGTIINLLPVLAVFAILGYAHINLDTATASIAAIVLGICVDDTIHYMYAYKKHLQGKVEVIDEHNMRAVRRSVLNSSLILLAGFGVMLTASLKTVHYFGLLISISVLVALIAHFYVLPLFVSLGKKTINHDS